MTSSAVVQIWTGLLDYPPEAFIDLLSEDELARANRFRFEVDRSRFVAGRGMLRTILGKWLGISPVDVTFTYGKFGKPALTMPGPHFSISHSSNRVVIALCGNHHVGVDIEAIRPLDRLEQLSETVFNSEERRQMTAWPPQDQQEAFFRGWARKEAFFKATGAGLSAKLHGLTIDLGATPRIVAVDGGDASAWSIHDLPIADGFAGAVVVASAPAVLEWLT